jgi:hypothetical protein
VQVRAMTSPEPVVPSTLLGSALIGFAAIGFALSGCTIPGIPTTKIVARESVTVNGRSCQYVERRTETATVNGMSRIRDNTIRCAGRDYACDDRTAEDCVREIEAGLARRNDGRPAG